ncbi:DUF5362 family protein [Parafilimonas terrae]|uniref:DUF5362 domain-containing protein n=1 Tax=Parafilimonas terrae TaxID=1465490 RepID=A0A1I5TKW4_9BACT|nr:DUF5362 family protein [Parafilimonas terrae]SFP83714.1 hypothetical protein SAMN05444277_102187 [Parafilimonas terrae]
MDENIINNNFLLQVDNGNTPYLTEAAKWAKFLSIIGFIICGLLVLTGVFSGSFFASLAQADNELNAMGSIGSTFFAMWFILCALLYFFPSYYLFNFASKMQIALRNNDQISLNDSFKSLKSCLKFWGILLIIILCFYALAIVFAMLGSAFIG